MLMFPVALSPPTVAERHHNLFRLGVVHPWIVRALRNQTESRVKAVEGRGYRYGAGAGGDF